VFTLAEATHNVEAHRTSVNRVLLRMVIGNQSLRVTYVQGDSCLRFGRHLILTLENTLEGNKNGEPKTPKIFKVGNQYKVAISG
jgi:hypothetical protein